MRVTARLCALCLIVSAVGCDSVEDPTISKEADFYPQARQLLVALQIPNANSLDVETIGESAAPASVEITFQGGHQVWVDSQTGTPVRYFLQGSSGEPRITPPYEGPFAVKEFGYDPLEDALQELLGIELRCVIGNARCGYEYLLKGMPVFEMPLVQVFIDDKGAVVGIENLVSMRLDEGDHVISKEQAIRYALDLLSNYQDRREKHLVHELSLGYVRTGQTEVPVVVRRVWRVPIGTTEAAYDFYIDAETGELVNGYRAGNGGRRSLLPN